MVEGRNQAVWSAKVSLVMAFCGAHGVLALWMMVLYGHALSFTAPGVPQEICIREYFEGDCRDDQVILMRNAHFGRMHTGRCAPSGNTNPSCMADVTSFFHEQCSGRPTCSVAAANVELFDLYTCAQEFIPYLKLLYDCIPVLYDRQHLHACHADGKVSISAESGVIASYVVFSHRSGLKLCPWIIEVNQGQRINITLVDFAWTEMSQELCHKYADITEGNNSVTVPVCRGGQMERMVYSSRSHRVQLNFEDYQDNDAQSYFLLEYTASGCSDPILHGHILLERTAESALLQCKSTGKTLSLQCEGRQWNMEPEDCESAGSSSSIQGVVLIIVVIAIVTITCICLMICLVYFLCIRRSRDQEDQSQRVYYEPHEIHTKVDLDYDWNSKVSYAKAGSQTYDQRNSGSKHYTHVWKPVNTDVMILETPDVPKRGSSLNNELINDPPLPKKKTVRQDYDEHAYETPNCQC